jgi:hypothetical protein
MQYILQAARKRNTFSGRATRTNNFFPSKINKYFAAPQQATKKKNILQRHNKQRKKKYSTEPQQATKE